MKQVNQWPDSSLCTSNWTNIWNCWNIYRCLWYFVIWTWLHAIFWAHKKEIPEPIQNKALTQVSLHHLGRIPRVLHSSHAQSNLPNNLTIENRLLLGRKFALSRVGQKHSKVKLNSLAHWKEALERISLEPCTDTSVTTASLTNVQKYCIICQTTLNWR